MLRFLNHIIAISLVIFLCNSIALCQTISIGLLQKVIEKHERILGLNDSTLAHETNQIRVFNLSDAEIEPELLLSINALSGLYGFLYKQKFTVNLVTDKKLTIDVNTGRYRDIFIVRFEERNSIIKLVTLAFLFKPKDGLNQNKLLGEFEFVKSKNGHELGNFRISGVD